jgi:MYXO-CTERM domain-containing protein
MTMRTVSVVTVSAAVVLSLASPVGAKTYHVAIGGSDNAAGTASAPLKTLQRAADLVGPGDDVLVADGQHAGFSLAKAGTAAAPITFKAKGSKAVINKAGSQGGSALIRLASYSRIVGFTISGGAQWGVRFSGTTGAVIRGCTVTQNSSVNVYGGHATSTLIEDNELSYSKSSHGLYVANSSTGVVVRHNRIHHNKTAGFHLNGDKSQPPGDGVIRKMLIERNTIHDNGQNGINMDGVQQSTIQNNLIYGNASNGIRGYVIDAGGGPKDLKIINNTILVPSTGFWCIRLTEDLGGNMARNNILLNDNSSNGSIALDQTKGFASDHNLVVNRFTLDRGSTVISLASWKTAGYGSGSAVSSAAALFVKPGSDRHIKAGCPAEDKGNANGAPTEDLDGVKRPQGAGIDVGCYERGGTAPADSGVPTDGGKGDAKVVADAAPSPDGLPATDGAPAADGAPAGDGTGEAPRADDGCSCALPGAARPAWPGLTLLLLTALLVFRRRRPDPRQP